MNHVSLMTDNYEKSSQNFKNWNPLGTVYACINIFSPEGGYLRKKKL